MVTTIIYGNLTSTTDYTVNIIYYSTHHDIRERLYNNKNHGKPRHHNKWKKEEKMKIGVSKQQQAGCLCTATLDIISMYQIKPRAKK
jgi:hypothetical protein